MTFENNHCHSDALTAHVAPQRAHSSTPHVAHHAPPAAGLATRQSGRTVPRPALIWPRRFFTSSRRCWAPRDGRVARRAGGGGASASVSRCAAGPGQRLPVLQLRAVLGRDDRQHAVHQPAGQTGEHPRPLLLGERGGRSTSPAQLDPAVGGVDRLPARPGRAAEPLDQFGVRDHQAVRQPAGRAAARDPARRLQSATARRACPAPRASRRVTSSGSRGSAPDRFTGAPSVTAMSSSIRTPMPRSSAGTRQVVGLEVQARLDGEHVAGGERARRGRSPRGPARSRARRCRACARCRAACSGGAARRPGARGRRRRRPRPVTGRMPQRVQVVGEHPHRGAVRGEEVGAGLHLGDAGGLRLEHGAVDLAAGPASTRRRPASCG